MINSRKLTTEEVIEKCKEIRGTEKFDYSFAKWESGSENIKIKCLKYNVVFDVRYYDFLGGVDCKECAREKLSKGVSAALKGRDEIIGNMDLNMYREMVYNAEKREIHVAKVENSADV